MQSEDSRNFDRTLKNRVTSNKYSTSFTQAEFWKIAYARLSSDLQNIYKINMIKCYILSQQDYKQDSSGLRYFAKRNETVLCEMVLCETVLCEMVLCETVLCEMVLCETYFAKRYFAKWYFAKRYFAKTRKISGNETEWTGFRAKSALLFLRFKS